MSILQKATILIVDDEKEIADLIAFHLLKENYHIITVYDGEEALKSVATNAIDLVILDIMMPKLNGYEVATRIREKYQMPIIFVSAKTSDFDKVHGLAIGADDYMTKPFVPIELIARVNAQLRRFTTFNQPQTQQNLLQFGGLTIDAEARSVTLYNDSIILTRKEFDILFLLASNPKKVFSTEDIFRKVWQEDYFEGANTVMVHIRTLRKKLREDKQKNKLISTVWGVGYIFNG